MAFFNSYLINVWCSSSSRWSDVYDVLKFMRFCVHALHSGNVEHTLVIMLMDEQLFSSARRLLCAVCQQAGAMHSFNNGLKPCTLHSRRILIIPTSVGLHQQVWRDFKGLVVSPSGVISAACLCDLWEPPQVSTSHARLQCNLENEKSTGAAGLGS